MTIPPDLEAQILRYYHVEKWRVGTIARQLHVHHGTVARVVAQAGLPRIGPPARRSQVEPYLPFIHLTLEGPLCLLRHNWQLSTATLVRLSSREDLAEMVVAAGSRKPAPVEPVQCDS